MEFRTASAADFAALFRLWAAVFGDDEEFVQDSLTRFAGWGHVYVAEDEQGITAQLLAVPCKIGDFTGAYFYALATQPAARGKGVMTRLMQHAETEEKRGGASFCVLIPASEPLYSYYQARGYTQPLWLWQVCGGQADIAAAPAPVDIGRITAEEFAALRAQYIKMPYVDFASAQYTLLLDDLYVSGAKIARISNGYAVYLVKDNKLTVLELFTKDTHAATALLSALLSAEAKEHFCVTMAEADMAATALHGSAKKIPAGLLKRLDDSFTTDEIYLRFGFDEL